MPATLLGQPRREPVPVMAVGEVTATPGLVITPAVNGHAGYTGGWAVTHQASGQSVVPNVPQVYAREAALRLGELAAGWTGMDWTATADRLRADQRVRDAAGQVRRQLQNARDEAAPLWWARPTSWTPVAPRYLLTTSLSSRPRSADRVEGISETTVEDLHEQGAVLAVLDTWTHVMRGAADAAASAATMPLTWRHTDDVVAARTRAGWQLQCAAPLCGQPQHPASHPASTQAGARRLSDDEYGAVITAEHRGDLARLARTEGWRRFDDQHWMCVSCAGEHTYRQEWL